jgi:hypothetical protein
MDLATKDYGFGTKSSITGSSGTNTFKTASGSQGYKNMRTNGGSNGGNMFTRPRYETEEQVKARLAKEEQARQLVEVQNPESFPTLSGKKSTTSTNPTPKKVPILAPKYVSAAVRIKMASNANLEKQDVTRISGESKTESFQPKEIEKRVKSLATKILYDTNPIKPEKTTVSAKWDNDGIDDKTGFIHSEWASCLEDDIYDDYHMLGSKALEGYEDDYVYDYDIDTDTFACREFGGKRLHYGEYNAMVQRMEEEASYSNDDEYYGMEDDSHDYYGSVSDEYRGYDSDDNDSVTDYSHF